MKILVIGSGGREHALIWKIAQSPLVKKIYAAPGNAGISQIAVCVPIAVNDIRELKNFVIQEKIDLTVVGPELPLVNGIVDDFIKAGLKIFGPRKVAAEIEGSKSFAKDLLKNHGVPAPAYKTAYSLDEALKYLGKVSVPIVIKADGLASGKGVIICESLDMAEANLNKIMKDKVFGAAGDKVIIEEYLTGKEVSIMALTDGKTIALLEPAQDYKRLMDDNKGPNTGGMGAYSPVAFVNDKLIDRVVSEIFVPTVHALNASGRSYRGLLYAGLMITPSGPKVLEFNARFGDPETQPLMMRLKSDLVPLLMAVVEQKLDKIKPIEWYHEPAVCAVMTAQDYPANPRSGDAISGLPVDTRDNSLQVFHAGTKIDKGNVVTAGGRVMGITARANDFKTARKKVYDTIKQISFDGAFYRTDIADFDK